MRQQIKNSYTGLVLFECDVPDGVESGITMRHALEKAVAARADLARAYLAGAYLAGAYLADANLAGANLAGAYLAGAYLAGANLADANLAGAYLAGAYLAGAYLAGANLADANLARAYLADAYLAGAYLAGANLADANLAGAYLAGAYLAGANLADANLAGANLAGAYLAGAKGLGGVHLARTRILPAGSLIGWKKCCNGVIVKLRIPDEARRAHAWGRKCRAEFADVLEVIGAEVGISLHDGKTEYRPGQRVVPDSFSENWQEECSNGVHFYITKEEAEAHS